VPLIDHYAIIYSSAPREIGEYSELRVLLSGLTMLKDLTIKNEPPCDITFDGGVIPLLEAAGSFLDALHLDELADVNIGAIRLYRVLPMQI
jgi:hypothetical protein